MLNDPISADTISFKPVWKGSGLSPASHLKSSNTKIYIYKIVQVYIDLKGLCGCVSQ